MSAKEKCGQSLANTQALTAKSLQKQTNNDAADVKHQLPAPTTLPFSTSATTSQHPVQQDLRNMLRMPSSSEHAAAPSSPALGHSSRRPAQPTLAAMAPAGTTGSCPAPASMVKEDSKRFFCVCIFLYLFCLKKMCCSLFFF